MEIVYHIDNLSPTFKLYLLPKNIGGKEVPRDRYLSLDEFMNNCKNAGFMNAKQSTIPIVSCEPSLLLSHLVQTDEEIHMMDQKLAFV